ncbi:MAG: toxin-antitoxin system YwqK family antitoxin [Bacteroidota bacterium]
MRTFFPILFLALCLAACKGELETVESEDADGNLIRFTRNTENYARQGVFTRLSPDGQKLEEAHYNNDTLDGQRTIFYPSGKAEIIENYSKGQFAGTFQTFYESGQLQLEGKYSSGAMNGEWRGYYESGQLKEIVRFQDNEENGPFKEFYSNGQPKAEGSYLNGDNEHGELLLYDENGELTKKMNCNHGICRTTWTKDEADAGTEKI